MNTYDANGNLTSDKHKGITNIQYNYLNLPQLISFTENRSIIFVYDASGAKLQKITNNNGEEVTYNYVNGVEYKENVLQRLPHTEGAVVRNEFGNYDHEYVLRDHLGNVRVSFKDGTNKGEGYFSDATWTWVDPNEGSGYNDGVITQADMTQVNHYYSFGMNMEGNWNGSFSDAKNKYQYGEKELNTDFGLNWSDYGARFYDPAIGRWGKIDPMAGKYVDKSPYNYALNNPILYIDPDGREVRIYYYEKGEDGVMHQKYANYRTNEKGVGQLFTKDDEGKEVLYTGSNDYLEAVRNDLDQLQKDDPELKRRINHLEKSTRLHKIMHPGDLGFNEHCDPQNSLGVKDFNSAKKGLQLGSATYYDAKRTTTTNPNQARTPRITLAHEFCSHAYDFDQGSSAVTKRESTNGFDMPELEFTKTQNGILVDEVNAVNVENIARAAANIGKRTQYENKDIPKELLNDTHKNKK